MDMDMDMDMDMETWTWTWTMGMDIKLYGHGQQYGHGHTWTRTTHTGTYLDRTFAVWLSLYRIYRTAYALSFKPCFERKQTPVRDVGCGVWARKC